METFAFSLWQKAVTRISRNFHGIIRNVEVLGGEAKAEWSRDEKGLHITSGKKSEDPIVFKIKID